jgi:hypothetical protein
MKPAGLRGPFLFRVGCSVLRAAHRAKLPTCPAGAQTARNCSPAFLLQLLHRLIIVASKSCTGPADRVRHKQFYGGLSPDRSPAPTAESLGGRTCRTGKVRRKATTTEGTMGIAIFLIIAFVMLGVDRLVHLKRSHHPVQHGAAPRS